jgi:hypothetical protein
MGRQSKCDIDPKELYLLYVDEGLSTVQIARLHGYFKPGGQPNAMLIHRALERAGIPIRNKSEAQKIALAVGTATHPTEGRVRTEEERVKIAVTLVENYKTASEADKKKRRRGVEEFWKDKNNQEAQTEAIRKRSQQLQKTISEGTILEQTLARNCIDWGYSVEMHQSKIFNDTLEADMIIKGKGINVCIESDGKRHWDLFMNNTPADLAKIIKTDQKKNGMVLAMKNVFMLRILWPFGSKTLHLKAALEKVYSVLEHFREISKTGNLQPQDRIVFLDMGLVINNRACTDNPNFRKAMKILKGNL